MRAETASLTKELKEKVQEYKEEIFKDPGDTKQAKLVQKERKKKIAILQR